MDKRRGRLAQWFRRRKRWQRVLLVLGMLALLAGVAALSAKPAYQLFRQWRIDRNAVEAHAALQAGHYEEARRLALSVLRMGEDRFDMVEVLQRSLEGLGEIDAANLARMMMGHSMAREEHWRNGFLKTCEQMPVAVVIGTWTYLGDERQRNPDYVAWMAGRLIDQGLWQAAGEVLDGAVDPGGRSGALRLQKARLWLALGKLDQVERGQAELAALMEEGGDRALEAFRLLATIPEPMFRSGYFPELTPWLDGLEGVTVRDRLLALRQAMSRTPTEVPAIIAGAVAKHGVADPAAVAEWLVARDRPEQALELLPPERARLEPETYRARCNALAALGRWPELADWLTSPPEKFSAVELRAQSVIVADRLGDTATRNREWSDALRAARADRSSNAFLELAERMQKAGMSDMANDAMVEAIRLGWGRLPMFDQVRGLLPWLRRHGRGYEMLECCATFVRLEPGNPQVLTDYLDMGCVFGKIPPSEAVQRFQELLSLRPDQPGAALGLATALLMDGKAAESLQAMGAPAAAGEEGRELRELAVRGLALATLGRETEAKEILARLDWKALLPEERDTFTRLLSRTRLTME